MILKELRKEIQKEAKQKRCEKCHYTAYLSRSDDTRAHDTSLKPSL